MLHAFDAETLNEAWAFIPNNLLYKLKLMKAVDPTCGEYLYHHTFVDGTPTIGDVCFADGSWHTVLVAGQGAGWGKNHRWYYFALDITDPLNPRPLWELTDAFMGEAWSIPAIAKIATPAKWVALFGSGYDNDGDPSVNVGNYFYCVDIETGAILRSFDIKESKEPVSPFGIQNTLPGSPSVVDIDQDGLADAAYFGDLKGRVWKINLTGDATGWNPAVIYRDPYGYPIITKPAVYVDVANSNAVHVYVGTGGDDLAPNTLEYSFVGLIDYVTGAVVEWYMGPDAMAGKLGIGLDAKKGSFVAGEKVWADPVIANRNIFIATLEGNIEALNPCNATSGGGKIYARYILGNQVGGTSLVSEGGSPLQYLAAEQKVRSAVTLGDSQLVQSGENQTQYMRKVYIQSFTQPGGGEGAPPSQVLAQPVSQSGLIIKRWQEIYKVYK
jgi:PilY1 beta-propeller domain